MNEQNNQPEPVKPESNTVQEFVAKLQRLQEYQKKVASNKYHAKKKRRAKLKKQSQRVCRINSKNFQKRQMKRNKKGN